MKTLLRKQGSARVLVVLAVAACSSNGQPGSSGGGGADNVGGSAMNGGMAVSGGAQAGGGAHSSGGAIMSGGSPSSGGSSADVTGPSCPDGTVALVLKQEVPMPTAECATFVEKVCPGELNDCAHHWCGKYLACACLCADNDIDCYARCGGFTADCDTCLTRLQECGIGYDIDETLHPGSPCFPPMQ